MFAELRSKAAKFYQLISRYVYRAYLKFYYISYLFIVIITHYHPKLVISGVPTGFNMYRQQYKTQCMCTELLFFLVRELFKNK